MKNYNKKHLPETIVYKGHLYRLNAAISVAMELNNTSLTTIAATLKKEGRRAILVNVLPPNIKGRTDLYGKPYKPTRHIFTT